jgi:DNA-binding CsgD family transcriptional regulator
MQRFDLTLVSRHRGLAAVTALQAVSAAYFVIDVLGELPEMRTEPIHPLGELLAVLALLIGTGFGMRELGRVMRRSDRAESRLRAASGAFIALMHETFDDWALTASERDVALLSIKGLSVAEIAALRNTRAGTVKAQCAAVYRKAGVNSRAELLGHFIEDLMSGDALAAASGRTDMPDGRSAVVASQHVSP